MPGRSEGTIAKLTAKHNSRHCDFATATATRCEFLQRTHNKVRKHLGQVIRVGGDVGRIVNGHVRALQRARAASKAITSGTKVNWEAMNERQKTVHKMFRELSRQGV